MNAFQREKLERLFIGVCTAQSDGRMEDIDARVEEHLELLLRKGLRVCLPLGLIGKVEREHAEHVNDQRPLHERNGARRVLRLTLRKQLVSAEVDHRGRHSCKTGDRCLREYLAA